MALAFAGLGFLDRFWGLAPFAFVFGIFYGGLVAVIPALVMDFFGGRNVGGLIGVLYTSVAAGTLISPNYDSFASTSAAATCCRSWPVWREHHRGGDHGGDVTNRALTRASPLPRPPPAAGGEQGAHRASSTATPPG